MTFRKVKIAIRTSGGVLFEDGYIFEAAFSTGAIHEMGVRKNEAKDALHRTNWIITDIQTGLTVCEGRTRRDVVEKFQKVYCSKLERMVMSNEHWSSVPGCYENYYEKMVREFSEMLRGDEK